MPLISVTYATQRETASLKAGIAAAITELTAKVLHKDPRVTAVIVKSVDAADWFAGGKSLAEHEIFEPALFRHHTMLGGVEVGHGHIPAMFLNS